MNAGRPRIVRRAARAARSMVEINIREKTPRRTGRVASSSQNSESHSAPKPREGEKNEAEAVLSVDERKKRSTCGRESRVGPAFENSASEKKRKEGEEVRGGEAQTTHR